MRLGLGLRVRAIRMLERLGRWRRQRPRTVLLRHSVERLHIGCGPEIFPGWTNIDLVKYPGVDLALDVRDGLPFADARYVYAEHFLEHLTYDEGLRFLRECRAAMHDEGVLRLSTPNLDWVHATQYGHGDAVADCFAINKSFRGWGHRFLYNAATLEATLHASGFADVRFFAYGVSDDPLLSGRERHERSADSPELPHVIVAEARGRRVRDLEGVEAAMTDFDRALRS